MTEFSVAIEIITIKPNGAQSNSQHIAQGVQGGRLKVALQKKVI